MEVTENDRNKQNDNHSTAKDSPKHAEHYLDDVNETGVLTTSQAVITSQENAILSHRRCLYFLI